MITLRWLCLPLLLFFFDTHAQNAFSDRRAGKRRAYALARRAAPKDPAMEALPSLDEREMLTVLRALSEHSPAAAELLADVARRVDSLRHLSKLRQMR